MTFNVVDDTGAVVAIAETDVANKTVTLTYTDYVENHANISGSLYFTSLIDFENVENESKIPIYVTVEGEKIFAGDLTCFSDVCYCRFVTAFSWQNQDFLQTWLSDRRHLFFDLFRI